MEARGGTLMVVLTFPGIVGNRTIRLTPNVLLPGSTKVYVVVPEGELGESGRKLDLAEMISRMPSDYQTQEETVASLSGRKSGRCLPMFPKKEISLRSLSIPSPVTSREAVWRDDGMTKQEDSRRIQQEITRITAVLEPLTGRVSQWNGRIELISDADFLGRKPFSCSILLDTTLASQEVRWRTLIHESLHALSAGYDINAFQQFRGWEEGTVEMLQRLLRPTVLSQIGVAVEETIFQKVEQEHPFNSYIEALENIRRAFGQATEAFYIALLQTPLRDRYSSLVAAALTLETGEHRRVLAVLAASRVVLERTRTYELPG